MQLLILIQGPNSWYGHKLYEMSFEDYEYDVIADDQGTNQIKIQIIGSFPDNYKDQLSQSGSTMVWVTP